MRLLGKPINYIELDDSNNTLTFESLVFFLAFHKSKFCCIFSQSSGVVPNAFDRRRAIDVLIPDRPFINSDSVFLVIPRDRAVSVTVSPNGSIYISLSTSPGCAGLYIEYFPFQSSDNLNNQDQRHRHFEI